MINSQIEIKWSLQRWKHIYKLWDKILALKELPQFDRWLSQEFSKNSAYGSKDRRWYSEVLFAAIRFGYFAVFCDFLYQHLDGNSQKISLQEFENISHLFMNDKKNILLMFKKLDIKRFFYWIILRYNFSNSKENKIIYPDKNENLELFFHNFSEMCLKYSEFSKQSLIFASVSPFFLKYLQERANASNWSKETQSFFLSSQDKRPPLWLRINHIEHLDTILNELKKENFNIIQQKNALKIEGTKGIFILESFKQGHIEIQDLASQHIGENIQVKQGQFIWDACAGGGGKTLQIASFLKNKGAIYASDIREYKLEELKKRAKRAGFHNIRCQTWQGEKLPAFSKEIQNNNGFDWVLVDAPCSSSGTWRRNPDAKYRITEEDILNVQTVQINLLQAASSAVKKEGYLVYSTCSWIVTENENVVHLFLKNNVQFKLINISILGCPQEDADTMFSAVFQKI